MTTRKKPTPTEKPAADGGLLASEHDVERIGTEIGQLLDGLRKLGVAITLDALDLNNLKARIEATAACRILVAKGIATEAEMAYACNQEYRAILAMLLQAVEERMLAAQGRPQPGHDGLIKPPGAGKLAVVRH